MSIAGGYYRAVEEAARFEMDCVQLFTKNNNQWRAKPITDEDVRLFREALEEHGIAAPCSHASYLINMGSPKDELWEKSEWVRRELTSVIMPWLDTGPANLAEAIPEMRKRYVEIFGDPDSEEFKEGERRLLEYWEKQQWQTQAN